MAEHIDMKQERSFFEIVFLWVSILSIVSLVFIVLMFIGMFIFFGGTGMGLACPMNTMMEFMRPN